MWLSAAASSLRRSRRAMGYPRSIPFASKLNPAGLLRYGADNLQMYRHVRCDTGQILKGAMPADLPIVQSTKFEFVINLQTAGPLSLDVPPTLLVR
jgi:putative ABC transport system substrate-binding protein